MIALQIASIQKQSLGFQGKQCFVSALGELWMKRFIHQMRPHHFTVVQAEEVA